MFRKSLTWATLGIAAFFVGTVATSARADGPYALVSGRRDPRVIVVDVSKAMNPANSNTSNAVVSRVRVSPDVPSIDPARVDAAFLGVTMMPADSLPSNVLASRGGKVYVVNHAGTARPVDVESGNPHGYPGALTVLDLKKTLDPANNNTTKAIDAIFPSGGYGPAGVIVTADGTYALVANSEGIGNEDGANQLGLIDLRQKKLARVLLAAMGTGGQVAQTPGHSCAQIALNPALVPHSSPDVNWGCFPDANGLAFTPRHGGYVFSANEGTHDVSVINLQKLIAGAPDWETSRIPVERGPWDIAVSPDGTLVAVTDRDSDETDEAGHFISLIDVDRAVAKDAHAEIRRVMVGTDDPKGESHPFGLAFTPDGKRILVANDLTGNVSVVDVSKARANDPKPEIARIALPVAPKSGTRPRPRGVAVTADSRFAAVSGGEPNTKAGGTLWIIDLNSFSVVGTVTGVGNQPYKLTIVPGN